MRNGAPERSDDKDAYAPVAGKVLEVNDGLAQHPRLVDEGGEKAWLVKVTVVSTAEGLMDEDAYKKFCKE